jgi:hypothetical protein
MYKRLILVCKVDKRGQCEWKRCVYGKIVHIDDVETIMLIQELQSSATEQEVNRAWKI